MNNTNYIYFELNGIFYRTDGVIVEGLDGSTWNRTNSLRVVLAARDAFNITRSNPRVEAIVKAMIGKIQELRERAKANAVCGPTIKQCADEMEETFDTAVPELLLRCMERHAEGGQCEFREGHKGEHLAGMIMWASKQGNSKENADQ